jgi:hypothetical protein
MSRSRRSTTTAAALRRGQLMDLAAIQDLDGLDPDSPAISAFDLEVDLLANLRHLNWPGYVLRCIGPLAVDAKAGALVVDALDEPGDDIQPFSHLSAPRGVEGGRDGRDVQRARHF